MRKREWVDQGLTLKATFAPDSLDVVLIENLELQAEPRRKFLLPLQEHGGRATYDNFLDFLAKEQFPSDEAGLDGFSQPHVVGYEKVDPGKPKRLAKRFQAGRDRV
jgi:hypothetical protein